MAVIVISMSTKQVTCHSCKSILEYKYHDTYTKRFTDYGGGSETYRGIDCPVCKSFVEVR